MFLGPNWKAFLAALAAASTLAFASLATACGFSGGCKCYGPNCAKGGRKYDPSDHGPQNRLSPALAKAHRYDRTEIKYYKQGRRSKNPHDLQMAAQYFLASYKLWRRPRVRRSLYNARVHYYNILAIQTRGRGDCRNAVALYDKALAWSRYLKANSLAILRENRQIAVRCAGRRVRPRPSYPTRTCSVCNQALVNDIRVRLGIPRRLRTYVSQSRAKYANCIRRIPGGCRGTTIYWKNHYALRTCFTGNRSDNAFAVCVRHTIR